MILLLQCLPALGAIAKWLLNLSTWLVARLLNMPQPLVQSTGIFVFAHVQAVETSVGKSLSPRRLQHRLRTLLRAR